MFKLKFNIFFTLSPFVRLTSDNDEFVLRHPGGRMAVATGLGVLHNSVGALHLSSWSLHPSCILQPPRTIKLLMFYTDSRNC